MSFIGSATAGNPIKINFHLKKTKLFISDDVSNLASFEMTHHLKVKDNYSIFKAKFIL